MTEIISNIPSPGYMLNYACRWVVTNMKDVHTTFQGNLPNTVKLLHLTVMMIMTMLNLNQVMIRLNSCVPIHHWKLKWIHTYTDIDQLLHDVSDCYPFPSEHFALLYLLHHSPRPLVRHSHIVCAYACTSYVYFWENKTSFIWNEKIQGHDHYNNWKYSVFPDLNPHQWYMLCCISPVR